MITIEIGDREYKVREAKTEEERKQGLKGIESLPEDEGMLFYMPDKKSQVVFTMEDMKFPLDIIFINQDDEVFDVAYNVPIDTEAVISDEDALPNQEDYVKYVLEVNPNSGIQVGDELDIEDSEDNSTIKMQVLAPDGSTQMLLEGGERICSRKNTRVLIKKAKKAYNLRNIKEKEKEYLNACKSLGKYMFKVLKEQDTREPEYVEAPK